MTSYFIFYSSYRSREGKSNNLYGLYRSREGNQTIDSLNLHKNTKSNFTQNFSKLIKNYRACLIIIFKNNFFK